ATWSRVAPGERAAYLVEAARRMRERRHVFSAWMVLEVGKSWAEADADTAEAVDFMEFYAREMLRYAEPQPVVQLPGGRDHSAVELPARDHGRHGHRRDRRRQHRRGEAVERLAGDRLAILRADGG